MEKIDRKPETFFQKVKRLSAPVMPGVKLWEGARFLLADVPLDPVETRKILPWGMRPAKPAKGTLFIADYPKLSFTFPYQEAALLVHVATPLGSGIHCPWMTVNDDTGLIYGREMLGFPKKWGNFRWNEDGNSVSAGITRRGVEVLKMEGVKKALETNPGPVLGRKTFNPGGPGSALIFQPIWLFKPRETILESRLADVKVTVSESELDPIARLISGPPTNGRFTVVDILGSSYNLPVGLSGPGWFANTYELRFR